VEELGGLHSEREKARFDEPEVQRNEAKVRRAHAGEHHAPPLAVAQAARETLERGRGLEPPQRVLERTWLIEDVAQVRTLDDRRYVGHSLPRGVQCRPFLS